VSQLLLMFNLHVCVGRGAKQTTFPFFKLALWDILTRKISTVGVVS